MDRFLGMDFNEFVSVVEELIPEATIGTDNEGQLIIYTNLTTISSVTHPTVALGDVLVERMGI